jgi:hypothetical protein
MDKIKLYFKVFFKIPSIIIVIIFGMYLLIKKYRSGELNIFDRESMQLIIRDFVQRFHPYDIHINFIVWCIILYSITR